jgi:integrase
MGSIYKRGKVWWIKFYLGGRRTYESSGSTKQGDAKRLLALREGQKAEGRVPNPRVEKTRFEDLSQLYLQDYEINGRKSMRDARRHAARLGQAFNGMRAVAITSDRIMTYVAARKAEGLEPASVNRELEALKRMFHLGARQTPPMVLQIPHIQMLREDNVRTGYFEHEEFLALRGVAGNHLKMAATIAYWTGMRRGEILSLTWDRVDFDEGFIRLDPGTTKTGEGRQIPFIGDLPRVLEDWWRRTRSKYPDCPWVIHYRGRPVRSLARAWAIACSKAGFKGKRFHDFRRTAIRNLVRAGVSEHVAMKISGHKTRSVFDRYDIVSEGDLREAARKMNRQMSTMTSTVTDYLEEKKQLTA